MQFIARVFGLRGRIGRGAFWLMALPWIFIIVSAQVALTAAQAIPQPKQGFAALANRLFSDITLGISGGQAPLLPLLVIFLAFVMFISAVVRRLRDLGRSPFLLLVLFWPAVMFVILQALEFIGVGKFMMSSVAQYPYVLYGLIAVGSFLSLWALAIMFEMAFRRGQAPAPSPQERGGIAAQGV